MLTHNEGPRKTMLVLLKHALVTCGIVATSLLTFVQGSQLSLTAADAPEGEGLTGVISPEPPEGLWEEDFLELGETWTEWSTGAGEDVFNFFTEEPTTIAEQEAALDAIASRLRVMEVALKDSAYAQLHPQLARLHSKLKPRHDLAVAALETLQLDPADAKVEQVASSKQNVVTAKNELAAFLRDYVGGGAWNSYLKLGAASTALADDTAPKELLATLNPIARKINQRQKLESKKQQEFLGKKPFLTLASAIQKYRKTVNAKPTEPDVAALRTELRTLFEALNRYETAPVSADAQTVHDTFGRLQDLALDGGDRIGRALRAHYINYNLHFVASETFLAKVVNDRRTESGVVSDYVLGASVYGNQTTSTTVGIDIKPDPNKIRFDLVLNGNTQSNTSGSTSQATVYTAGNAYFEARKQITFDGETFATAPAQVGVNANNNTYAASTKLDGIPLLGGIARGIAKSTAKKKRGQSEAITRSKISQKVRPQFNEEADNQFSTATQELNEKFYRGLRETNLYPSAMNFGSSESHVLADTRTMLPNELGGSRPLLMPVSQTGAMLDLHQSALNNIFNQAGLAGKTMTDKQFADHMREFFNKAFSLDLKPEEKTEPYDEEDPTSFVFYESDPLRVKFDAGEVILTIRAGLKQEGDDDIPPQEITVPLTFTVNGETILMETGRVGVAPIGDVENFAVQATRAGIMRKKIERAFSSQELDGKIELNTDEPTVTPTLIYVREISPIYGWLRVMVE